MPINANVNRRVGRNPAALNRKRMTAAKVLWLWSGMSQSELARRVGTSTGGLNMLLNGWRGTKKPRPETKRIMTRIAEELGLPYDAVWGAKAPTFPHSINEKA